MRAALAVGHHQSEPCRFTCSLFQKISAVKGNHLDVMSSYDDITMVLSSQGSNGPSIGWKEIRLKVVNVEMLRPISQMIRMSAFRKNSLTLWLFSM